MSEVEPTGGAFVGAFFITLLNLIGSACVGVIVMVVCAVSLKCLRLPSREEKETTTNIEQHTHRHSAEIQCLVLLIFSYLTFALCEGLTLSGIVASLSGGLTASLYCAGTFETFEKLKCSKLCHLY